MPVTLYFESSNSTSLNFKNERQMQDLYFPVFLLETLLLHSPPVRFPVVDISSSVHPYFTAIIKN